MVADLHELLALRGHAVSELADGFSSEGVHVVFTPVYDGAEADGDAVILTLEARAEPPQGVAVLDLLGRRVLGSGGFVLDSLRELCRKRGIRLEPGPWRYPGGLV